MTGMGYGGNDGPTRKQVANKLAKLKDSAKPPEAKAEQLSRNTGYQAKSRLEKKRRDNRVARRR